MYSILLQNYRGGPSLKEESKQEEGGGSKVEGHPIKAKRSGRIRRTPREPEGMERGRAGRIQKY